MKPVSLCAAGQGEERDLKQGWRGGQWPDHAGEGMRLLSPSNDLVFPRGI